MPLVEGVPGAMNACVGDCSSVCNVASCCGVNVTPLLRIAAIARVTSVADSVPKPAGAVVAAGVRFVALDMKNSPIAWKLEPNADKVLSDAMTMLITPIAVIIPGRGFCGG